MKNTQPQIVTISGADDNVNIEDIKAISKDFPFVEWGILFSPKNFGKPRYPSKEWLKQFIEIDVKKSIHLCGPAAKGFAINSKELGLKERYTLHTTLDNFDRVQINIAKQINDIDYNLIKDNIFGLLTDHCILQIGLGCEKIYNQVSQANSDFGINVYPFLDVSGGQGLMGEWKLDFEYQGYRGFAGGINPENVQTVIETINNNNLNNDPFWIDMESGVRVDDKLDLNLVKKVLTSIY